MANLFNKYPALNVPNGLVIPNEVIEAIEETREEKTYRNWINSMGISSNVNYLYTDLQDCLIIFQVWHILWISRLNLKGGYVLVKQIWPDLFFNYNYSYNIFKALRSDKTKLSELETS